MGAAFMVLLPEVVQAAATGSRAARSTARSQLGELHQFPAGDGDRRGDHPVPDFRTRWPARRWRLIKAYWKLYPYPH
jgi:branched-chain amino acid transport system permease protein